MGKTTVKVSRDEAEDVDQAVAVSEDESTEKKKTAEVSDNDNVDQASAIATSEDESTEMEKTIKVSDEAAEDVDQVVAVSDYEMEKMIVEVPDEIDVVTDVVAYPPKPEFRLLRFTSSCDASEWDHDQSLGPATVSASISHCYLASESVRGSLVPVDTSCSRDSHISSESLQTTIKSQSECPLVGIPANKSHSELVPSDSCPMLASLDAQSKSSSDDLFDNSLYSQSSMQIDRLFSSDRFLAHPESESPGGDPFRSRLVGVRRPSAAFIDVMEPLGEKEENSDESYEAPQAYDSSESSQSLAGVISTNIPMGRSVEPCSSAPMSTLASEFLADVGLVSRRDWTISMSKRDEEQEESESEMRGDLYPTTLTEKLLNNSGAFDEHLSRPLREQNPFLHTMQEAVARAAQNYGNLPPMINPSEEEWSSSDEEGAEALRGLMSQFSAQRTTTMTGANELEALKSLDLRKRRRQVIAEANNSMILSSMKLDEVKLRTENQQLRTIFSDDHDLLEEEAERSLRVRWATNKDIRSRRSKPNRASIVDCLLEDHGSESARSDSLCSLDFEHVAAHPASSGETPEDSEIDCAKHMFVKQRTRTMMGSNIEQALSMLEKKTQVDLEEQVDSTMENEPSPIFVNGDFSLAKLAKETDQVLAEAERTIEERATGESGLSA
ncbi:MAG: hypothetical protein KVP17_000706 [Porospora cf. gigantea B]|uniref:uncharacterized protein n=1 Tax=Porospora cf. gigantea B TaxID=2853592 RepID=UPI003571834B|nr:MAG: hypothetical protein KVP17_000706 [Porospora cf. gigantea B]